MKKVLHQNRPLLLLFTIVVIFLSGAFGSVFAQKGIGAKYGAHDPRTCADTKSPASGAMTAAQAKKYIICNQERQLSDNLYLVENVQVTVGSGRPYIYFNDSRSTGIDTTALVYDIRGSFDKYQCSAVSAFMANAGKNCTLYHEPKAEGKCYKNTFGEWYCNMEDLNNNTSDREYNLPPPLGKTDDADQDKPTAAANRRVEQNNTQRQAEDTPRASNSEGKHVDKDKLLNALRTKALTIKEILPVIKKEGVGFQLTPEIETALREAGATEALIKAVRENYRQDD